MRASCVCLLGGVTVTLFRDGRVLVTLPVARVPAGVMVGSLPDACKQPKTIVFSGDIHETHRA